MEKDTFRVQATESKPNSGVSFSMANKALECLESVKFLLDFKTNLLTFMLGNTVMNLTQFLSFQGSYYNHYYKNTKGFREDIL